MICHLVYVACDQCGAPIGTTDDLADDAKEARRTARRLGATRARRADGKLVDLCRACSEGVTS
jgi:hypothetical protein